MQEDAKGHQIENISINSWNKDIAISLTGAFICSKIIGTHMANNNGGVILIEDTHTSFMNYKGFKNPSKNSLINFTTNIIENLHRRNPMVKKRMNDLSKKIYSIEYFDSIVLFNINKKKLSYSKNLHNNKKLNPHFIDYRFKRPNAIKEYSQENFVTGFFKSKISKKGLINRVYENNIIKKYLKKIKK